MPFKFDIQELEPVYIKDAIWLHGKLLEGEIHENDLISVPVESGNIAHGFVAHLQVDYKNVSEVTSEQPAELVSIAVRRMSKDEMERIQLGIVTDRVKPPVAIDEPPVKQPTPPGRKKSAWSMLWRP